MQPSQVLEREDGVKFVTGRCLIATDVDKTILSQDQHSEKERAFFFQRVAPELAEAARLGAHIGFITGNSMHELCSRVLRFLLDELAHRNSLDALSRFHFFCNSGGVYFHLNPADIIRIKNSRSSDRIKAITSAEQDDLSIQPKFIDSDYLERCMILDEDAIRIKKILKDAVEHYLSIVQKKAQEIDKVYDLSWVSQDGAIRTPVADMRFVRYRATTGERQATVQITLKPILSFRQAKEAFKTDLVKHDVRGEIIEFIQNALRVAGLSHYVARGGGRASIDVTLGRLNKAYALEFLIDRLRLQGNDHWGQQFGSNTIYFGDEVIVGSGNDYPVTRIPGLMTFAVNPDKNLVPFLSPVLVASTIFHGPDATAEIVSHFNSCARRLLADFHEGQVDVRTAVDFLKEEIFAQRVDAKITQLKTTRHISVDEWQTLHTFVTLMSREKSSSRQWLSVLAKQLDSIMIQLATSSESAVVPALGTSRPATD